MAHPTEWLSVQCFQIKLEFRFLWREENRRARSPWSKHEKQQQCQPTYDAGSRIRTRATLVGGERSNYCAIPAPLNKKDLENKTRSYQTLLGLDDQGEISPFNIEWENIVLL